MANTHVRVLFRLDDYGGYPILSRVRFVVSPLRITIMGISHLSTNFSTDIKLVRVRLKIFILTPIKPFASCLKDHSVWVKLLSDDQQRFLRERLVHLKDTFKIHLRSKSISFKIHPVKFENRLPIEGMD